MDITRPTLALITGRMIGAAFTFLLPAVLVRVLAPDDFSTYRQLFLIYTSVYVAAQFGMWDSLYYFLPRLPASGGRYVANASLAIAAIGLAVGAALWLAAPWIAHAFDNPDVAAYLPLVAVFTGLMLVAAGLEIVMITRGRYVLAGVTYAASDAVRALALILPGLIIGHVGAVMAGAAAFALLRVITLAGFVRREFRGGLRLDGAHWRRQLAYTVPFGTAAIIEVSQLYYHQYAVASWFDAATFAIYSVACLQLPIVDLLGTSTINVMMVAMAERDGDRRAMLALWHATIARLTMVFLPLVTLLFLVADDLITLIYTEAFSASVPIFRLSLVFILLFAIPVDGALRVFARTRFILGMNVFRLAFIAASIGWFIGAFGLIGAMVTPVLATALVKLGALWRIRRLLEVRAVDLIPWRSLAANVTAVAIAAVPAWLVKIELDLPQLASIAVVSAVFAVACLAILGATRALQTTIGPVIPHQERVG
jgi:O-antigen/teichoic acid export membrane protein